MTFLKGTRHEFQEGAFLNRPLLAAIFIRTRQALEEKRKVLEREHSDTTDIEKGEKVLKAFFSLLEKESDPTGLKPEAEEILRGRLLIKGNPQHEMIRIRCPKNWQIFVELYKGVIGWLRVRMVRIFRPDGSLVCNRVF